MKFTKKQLRNYIRTKTLYSHIAENDKLCKYFVKSNYYKWIGSLEDDHISYYCEKFSNDIYDLNLTY